MEDLFSPVLTSFKLVWYANSELYQELVKLSEVHKQACSVESLLNVTTALKQELTEGTVHLEDGLQLGLKCSVVYPFITFALLSFTFFLSFLVLRTFLTCLLPNKKPSLRSLPAYFLAKQQKDDYVLWVDEQGVHFLKGKDSTKKDQATLCGWNTIYSWDFKENDATFTFVNKIKGDPMAHQFKFQDSFQLRALFATLNQTVQKLAAKKTK